MSRGSKDIPTVIEDLRVLHMAVAQPLRHLQLIEDFDRPSKMLIGCVNVAQRLFEPTAKTVYKTENDPFSSRRASRLRPFQIGVGEVKIAFPQIDLAEIGQDETASASIYIQLLYTGQSPHEVLLG
jgi:hypothetical protein